MNEFGAPETLDYDYVFVGGALGDEEQADDSESEITSDDEDYEPATNEPPKDDERLLPDKVPVIELSDVKKRRDGKGYDVDMKLRNFSVKNSGPYTIFQNIDRGIIGDDEQAETTDFSEAWKLGGKLPTDSFYVEPDWYSKGKATYSITADIWIEKDAGSLKEQGYEKGEPGKQNWGNTPGREDLRDIPYGAVFIRREGLLHYKDGALESFKEERTLYRMLDTEKEITEEEARELAIEPTRRRATGDREYNKRMRV